MDIKYKWVIWIGAVFVILMAVCLVAGFKKRADDYTTGKKVAGPIYSRNDEYFQRRVLIYKSGLMVAAVLCIICVSMVFVMIAKPFSRKRVQDKRYCRDIMLCIDISTSVDYLNENLLEELKKTVDDLQGERFGIVIFNTSPVLLTPLTDDYEFVKDQLDMIAECLKVRNEDPMAGLFSDGMSGTYNWLYYESYISSGTLVGNEQRGSSLIGDGLAAAACDFSDKDKDRTKVIIFSTDNDIQGTPVATLDEAASICKNNGVTVYGVGTKEMTDENRQSMKSAVESTGGQMFMEEESGSFDKIVSEIEKSSQSLVKTRMITQEIPEIMWPFAALVIAFAAMLGTGRALKL